MRNPTHVAWQRLPETISKPSRSGRWLRAAIVLLVTAGLTFVVGLYGMPPGASAWERAALTILFGIGAGGVAGFLSAGWINGENMKDKQEDTGEWWRDVEERMLRRDVKNLLDEVKDLRRQLSETQAQAKQAQAALEAAMPIKAGEVVRMSGANFWRSYVVARIEKGQAWCFTEGPDGPVEHCIPLAVLERAR